MWDLVFNLQVFDFSLKFLSTPKKKKTKTIQKY